MACIPAPTVKVTTKRRGIAKVDIRNTIAEHCVAAVARGQCCESDRDTVWTFGSGKPPYVLRPLILNTDPTTLVCAQVLSVYHPDQYFAFLYRSIIVCSNKYTYVGGGIVQERWQTKSVRMGTPWCSRRHDCR